MLTLEERVCKVKGPIGPLEAMCLAMDHIEEASRTPRVKLAQCVGVCPKLAAHICASCEQCTYTRATDCTACEVFKQVLSEMTAEEAERTPCAGCEANP